MSKKSEEKMVSTNNSGNKVTVVTNRGTKLAVKVEGKVYGKTNN